MLDRIVVATPDLLGIRVMRGDLVLFSADRPIKKESGHATGDRTKIVLPLFENQIRWGEIELAFANPEGEGWVPNITPHQNGIKAYSKSDLASMLR